MNENAAKKAKSATKKEYPINKREEKGKQRQRSFDTAQLYREPKKRRTENEAEIIAYYRASMNKEKRKYKQRKSKYDPAVWNSLPLNRPSKRMLNEEAEEWNLTDNDFDKSTKIDCGSKEQDVESEHWKETELIDKVVSFQNEQTAKKPKTNNAYETKRQRKEKRKTSNQEQARTIQSRGTEGERNTREEHITSSEEYGDTLIVRRMLQFLLEENDEKAKKNMLLILKRNQGMRQICLKEIKERFIYFQTMHENITSLVQREQQNLINLSACLDIETSGLLTNGECNSVSDIGNDRPNEYKTDRKIPHETQNDSNSTPVQVAEVLSNGHHQEVSSVPYVDDQTNKLHEMPDGTPKSSTTELENEKTLDEIPTDITFSNFPEGLLEEVVISLPSEKDKPLEDVDFMDYDLSTDSSSLNMDEVLQISDLINFESTTFDQIV